MTRNTDGEMWHLDYNLGFHNTAGQIEQRVGLPVTFGLLFHLGIGEMGDVGITGCFCAQS